MEPQTRAAAVIAAAILSLLVTSRVSAQLVPDFYQESCPGVFDIVQPIVQQAVEQEPRMAASLLRLHFHDCFVNGCDGSNLLDDTATFTGEKNALPNKNSLRGFEVIDNIKSTLENECSETVSCADILAIAARDSVVLTGGPSWTPLLGRRDSYTTSQNAANQAIPAPTDSLSTIISKFQAVGLSADDVVILSGSHTIGRARCTTFSARLYNFSNTLRPDPSLSTFYMSDLESVCPQNGDPNALNALDSITPDAFDNNYFSHLRQNEGLLQSDQELYSTQGASTASLVDFYAFNNDAFYADFAASMVKMGNINPLTGLYNGQVRKNCRQINRF